VESLTIDQQGQEQVASRIDPESMDLLEFQGRFYSPELETFYELAVEEGILLARHIRHEPITLTPTGPRAFSGSIWFFGQAVFERGEDGNVVAVLESFPDNLDQSPEFDPADPEPIPQDDFDQTWGT
jgi:hypothetical protein